MTISYALIKKKQMTVLPPPPHQVVVMEYWKSQLLLQVFSVSKRRIFGVKCWFYLAAYAT